MKLLQYSLLSFGLAALMFGCSDNSSSDAPLVPEITAITIEGTDTVHAIVIDEDQARLIGRISYSDDTNSTTYNELDWESNDTSVMQVHNGLLSPQSNHGKATITASYRDRLFSQNEQVVTIIPLTDINITSEDLTIENNRTDITASGSYQLMANGTFEDNSTALNISSNIVWTSTNTSVVTVDTSGLLTLELVEQNSSVDINVSVHQEINASLELNITTSL